MLRTGREEEDEDGEMVLGWNEYLLVAADDPAPSKPAANCPWAEPETVVEREVGSPLEEGVEEARGMRPRPPEERIREGEVTKVVVVVVVWDSHLPTLSSILGDIPGYFFLPAHTHREKIMIG